VTTFLGMGKDETTAVFCVSERAADEAAAADPATCEAVRRRDARRSFLGLQVQLTNSAPARVRGLVQEAWRQQAPKQLITEHDRTGPFVPQPRTAPGAPAAGRRHSARIRCISN
jgi:hypothetical protein